MQIDVVAEKKAIGAAAADRVALDAAERSYFAPALAPATGFDDERDCASVAARTDVKGSERNALFVQLVAGCTFAVPEAECRVAVEAGQVAQAVQNALGAEKPIVAAVVWAHHGTMLAADVVVDIATCRSGIDFVDAAVRKAAALAVQTDHIAVAEVVSDVVSTVRPDTPAHKSWGRPLAWCM